MASEKNDIIADCLALMFSQFPKDPRYDIFYEEARKGETEDSKKLRQKVCGRVIGVFKKSTFRIEGPNITFNMNETSETSQNVRINIQSGQIDSDIPTLKARFEGLLGSVLKDVRARADEFGGPGGQFSRYGPGGYRHGGGHHQGYSGSGRSGSFSRKGPNF